MVLSLSTCLLGCALIVTGKLELASLVQYLPMPVVGGYLAFIGFFCFEAGLSLMSGAEIKVLSFALLMTVYFYCPVLRRSFLFLTFPFFFLLSAFVFICFLFVGVQDFRKLYDCDYNLIWPGVVTGLSIYTILFKMQNAAILPVCMAVILVVFYTSLSLSGATLAVYYYYCLLIVVIPYYDYIFVITVYYYFVIIILLLLLHFCYYFIFFFPLLSLSSLCFYIIIKDARETGWIAEMPDETPMFWTPYELFEFPKVHWAVIPYIFPTWVAMYFVVAFSSSLDVAAIEIDLGVPLDYNHELMTVGISNAVSGLVGGYTGSYIFSQTIFTMRSKTNSRVNGIVIILCQLATFLLPLSVISYVPKMFFGALLTFIAVDLMLEWLYFARERMQFSEVVIVWLTFISILIGGLEMGISAGIMFAVLNFMLTYASFEVVDTGFLHRSSCVERGFQQRQILSKYRNHIVSMELQGYIFLAPH